MCTLYTSYSTFILRSKYPSSFSFAVAKSSLVSGKLSKISATSSPAYYNNKLKAHCLFLSLIAAATNRFLRRLIHLHHHCVIRPSTCMSHKFGSAMAITKWSNLSHRLRWVDSWFVLLLEILEKPWNLILEFKGA